MDKAKVLAYAKGIDGIINSLNEWTPEIERNFEQLEESLLFELSSDSELLPNHSDCYVQDVACVPGIVHVRVLAEHGSSVHSYDIEIDTRAGTVRKL